MVWVLENNNFKDVPKELRDVITLFEEVSTLLRLLGGGVHRG